MKELFKIIKFLTKHPIAGKHKLRTIFRFIYWQIFSRLGINKKTFHFINDSKMHISAKQTIATGNYYVGLLEFEEMAFILHSLNSSDIFFDVGANIGVYSVIASSVCGAKSYCFEPLPETFSLLNQNIQLNNIQNKIIAYNIGLSNEDSELIFSSNLDARNHVLNSNDDSLENVKISVKTLNDFKDFKPTTIKIDVEGYEKFILEGGHEILSQNNLNAIIIEINHDCERYNVKPSEIHNLLIDFGFKLCRYSPFKRELSLIEFPQGENRIYIRNINLIKEKISKAEYFKIHGIRV
jgi:FkbM family methyltransferase